MLDKIRFALHELAGVARNPRKPKVVESLSAKIIRADGTVEDLGVISETKSKRWRVKTGGLGTMLFVWFFLACILAMADVLTNNGEEWAASRLLGSGSLNVAATHGGFGTDGTAAAKGDTALGVEVETRGAVTATLVGTGASAVAQYVWTNTATATRAIQEAGLFTASSGGTMLTSHNFTTINLSSGDAIQFTLQINPA